MASVSPLGSVEPYIEEVMSHSWINFSGMPLR